MKTIILLLLSIQLLSCSTKKNEQKHLLVQEKKLKTVVDTLTSEEINIVNDFLKVELASDRYKNYKNLEIVLIEEANNRIDNVLTYEYAYRNWHNNENNDDKKRLGWILDSTQIKEIKNKYKGDKEYHWKNRDIINYKVDIIKTDVYRKITQKGANIDLPEKLILHLTRPFLIDSHNAFISFNSSSGRFGNSINHLTTLMKKTNGKWEMTALYWDGKID